MWFVLLAITSLWLAATVIPILYATLFRSSEFQKIIQELEANGPSGFGSDTAIQGTVAQSGRLRRAIQISYYSEVTVVVTVDKNLSAKRSQAGYVAWFENRKKPIFLLIQEIQIGKSATTYDIDEGDPGSLVKTAALPLLAFVASLYMVRRKTSMPRALPMP